MKKKIVNLLLVSMLAISLTACGESTTETVDFTPIDVITSITSEQTEDDVIPQIELDEIMIEELYGITPDMYEAVEARAPMMSAHCDEYVIIQAVNGQEDAIISAFEERQAYLVNPANMGYPEHIEYAQNYILEKNANMIVFAIGMSADSVLAAFQAQ